MKKYNRIIMLSVLLWLVIAVCSAYGIKNLKSEKDTAYKVEINRLYNSLSGNYNPDGLDLRRCKYVENVEFLQYSDMEDKNKTEQFCMSDNKLETEIRPLYNSNSLWGFVKFEYSTVTFNPNAILIIVETALLVMELIVLVILLYIKIYVLRPFNIIENMPYELAQGNLKGVIKEEKNRFFGKFLWGLGLLKDKLDVEKKRTLQLEKEKKMLLLSLSHDIKTPLNNIKLYSKALMENLYTDDAGKQSALSQIGVNAGEIEDYVNQIMKHSKEDILHIEVNVQEIYLQELINKVLSTYKEKCAINMTQLQVAPYNNRLIKCDPDRGFEVFENIFENAFKYGDGRKIQIDFSEEEDCLLISVFNTGKPVSENDFNHIFDSFYRASNSKGKAGNGLGLYICKEIMSKMGGDIYAQRLEDGMKIVLVYN